MKTSNANHSTHRSGLPWPEAYSGLLPVIEQEWGIDELYLTRRLSGKSGALVFAADIVSRDFIGQAILKLDCVPDPAWQEKSEAERHRLAFETEPDYAAKHLPNLVHAFHHGSQMAILSSIAGRGLEYAIPWHLCAYDRQLEVIHRVSRELLEGWNQKYVLAEGLLEPQELLKSWLQHRLDPAQGRLHAYLSDECGLDPNEPSISFEGHWYPNPLAFATRVVPPTETLRMRAIRGHQHGDLHGFNLLVGLPPAAEPEYYLIDLAGYENDQFLFHDHALFELNYLLFGRESADDAHWLTILDHLSYFRHLEGVDGLRGDDVGLIELIRAERRALLDWVDRHESNRLSYMESQYLLARVAAGLNFVNKQMVSDSSRRKSFVYAASNLKDYLKINDIDWPKHGPAFSIGAGARTGTDPADGDMGQTQSDFALANPPLPDKPSIAVLAFENLSGDAEQEYFADGISLEIMTALSRDDWLMVISRGATFTYKGQAVDPKRVARELGVHYVVEGDVRKFDNLVRITVHLVDGHNGRTIWVERYERALEDIFALQDEISQSIVANIDTELKTSQRESAHRRRGHLNTWDRFQKGLWHFFKFKRRDSDIARQLLTRITERTPNFAPAHAILAVLDCRSVATFVAENPDATLKSALQHATRAVSLDDRNSLAHLALSRVYTEVADYERSISECETAIALNPSSSVGYACLALALLSSGRATEAMPPLETSLRLSPRGPGVMLKLVVKAWIHYYLGQLSEAESSARSVPGHDDDADLYRWLILAATYAHQNRDQDARAAIDALLGIRGDLSLTKVRRSWQNLTPGYLEMILSDLEQAGLPS